jgi:hypothetical protein
MISKILNTRSLSVLKESFEPFFVFICMIIA